MAQRPNAIGLHVCELLIFEEGTGNATLANCFTGRVVDQVPSDPLSFVIFSALTDGQGTVRVEVRIQRPDNLEEVYEDAMTVTFNDPLHEVWCRFFVRGCIFPIDGEYQICLFADGEVIAQRRFTIQLGDE